MFRETTEEVINLIATDDIGDEWTIDYWRAWTVSAIWASEEYGEIGGEG